MTMKPFEDVVATHGAMVLRVCRSLLGPHDADDAWSETFLAAMRGYPDLRADSNVAGWLATIAHNKSIDLLRHRARTPLPVDDIHERSASVTVDGPEPADEALRGALDALTPKQRGAVIYHHIAGLPYAEVGVLLDSSEAAARRSAADGIANLRKTYQRGERP
ncbi:MAG: RNA polymerase sigma factor [Aquihabitans sp.]